MFEFMIEDEPSPVGTHVISLRALEVDGPEVVAAAAVAAAAVAAGSTSRAEEPAGLLGALAAELVRRAGRVDGVDTPSEWRTNADGWGGLLDAWRASGGRVERRWIDDDGDGYWDRGFRPPGAVPLPRYGEAVVSCTRTSSVVVGGQLRSLGRSWLAGFGADVEEPVAAILIRSSEAIRVADEGPVWVLAPLECVVQSPPCKGTDDTSVCGFAAAELAPALQRFVDVATRVAGPIDGPVRVEVGGDLRTTAESVRIPETLVRAAGVDDAVAMAVALHRTTTLVDRDALADALRLCDSPGGLAFALGLSRTGQSAGLDRTGNGVRRRVDDAVGGRMRLTRQDRRIPSKTTERMDRRPAFTRRRAALDQHTACLVPLIFVSIDAPSGRRPPDGLARWR